MDKEYYFQMYHLELANQLGLDPRSVKSIRNHLLGDKQTIPQTIEHFKLLLERRKSKKEVFAQIIDFLENGRPEDLVLITKKTRFD